MFQTLLFQPCKTNKAINTMNKKEAYEAPRLTVVKIQVEQGFQASGAYNMRLRNDESSDTESFGFRSGWSDESDDESNSFWD